MLNSKKKISTDGFEKTSMMSEALDKIAYIMVLNEDLFFNLPLIGYLFIGIKNEVEETIPQEKNSYERYQL